MTNQVEVSAEIEKVLLWDLEVSRAPSDVREHYGKVITVLEKVLSWELKGLSGSS